MNERFKYKVYFRYTSVRSQSNELHLTSFKLRWKFIVELYDFSFFFLVGFRFLRVGAVVRRLGEGFNNPVPTPPK